MNKQNARILVIGAGVNGSICASALFNAGIDVTVLARGKRYEELKDQGVVIEDLLTKARSAAKVPVIAALEPEDVYDFVLVVIHKHQVGDILPVLARNKSPNVVFMCNNPSGPEEFVSAIGRSRVMLGWVFGILNCAGLDAIVSSRVSDHPSEIPCREGHPEIHPGRDIARIHKLQPMGSGHGRHQRGRLEPFPDLR
jgi:ketopantoate reductase